MEENILPIVKEWQDWGQIHSRLEIYFEERLSGRDLEQEKTYRLLLTVWKQPA